MVSQHLAIYLNDHLAGSEGALELLGHLAEVERDTPFGPQLLRLKSEIELERNELEQLMERLQVSQQKSRQVVAWLAEKVAGVKLYLDDRAEGEMRLFEALEVLLLGLTGQNAMWRVLAEELTATPELRGPDYERLIAQTEEQLQRVRAMHLAASKAAFAV